ncbi:MAG: NAD(P)/FAD-dependent oxidoreductase, partial [Thiohalophilus sp.]
RKVIVLDHANKPGKKILMSGGGRCNFTNYDISADHYLSRNPHFCKSALSRYTQWDFIALLDSHHIPWHEKAHGQLFCDHSARDVLNMLLDECRRAGVEIRLNCSVKRVEKTEASPSCGNNTFTLYTSQDKIEADSVVIASGGLSIPKMCATPFGYRIAGQFGLGLQPTRAALVPFTWQPQDKARLGDLTGVAVDSIVSNARISFRESLLFTHRGLSGPAILQISSYWQPGETITINLLPDQDVASCLKTRQSSQPRSRLRTVLGELLPKRLVAVILEDALIETPLQALSHTRLNAIARQLQQWEITPGGSEGYRTAEVTLGGVDCDELSSRTMESKRVPGLYFIGEVVDVTGWLGGYNFQWAWSSGWVAGQVV